MWPLTKTVSFLQILSFLIYKERTGLTLTCFPWAAVRKACNNACDSALWTQGLKSSRCSPLSEPHSYWHCSVFPSSILNSPFVQLLAETTESQEAILLCILSTRLRQEKVPDSTALECLGMTV